MVELLVVLLSVVSLLLVAQIASLVRVRSLIKQLKIVSSALKILTNYSVENQKHYPNNIKKCQFCKFRKSYLRSQLDATSELDTFYYLCTLNSKSIKLNQSCKYFQPEFSLLDKTDLAG